MKRTRMVGDMKLDLKKIVLLLAVVALVVGLVFHLMYLFTDRSSSDTSEKLYSRENAKMFFLLAVGLGVVSMSLPAHKKSM